MSTGSFCISIDVERAWGIWDRPSAEYFARCLRSEHRILEALLELFARYEVPATWAIVGRLLEDGAGRAGDPKLWHAPECVAAIRAATPAHEIGSHSYEHIYFSQVSGESARQDLSAARRLHGERGLPFTSFVFPRNAVAHLDVLAEQGVRVFRSTDRGLHTEVGRRLGRMAGRAANLLDKVLPIPPVAVQPIRHGSGMVELPSSMLLMSRNGTRRAIHPRVTALKAKLGLDAAMKSGGVFHLWFHPSNFYYDTERQLSILEQILARASSLRERGQLAIRTMGSFASA